MLEEDLYLFFPREGFFLLCLLPQPGKRCDARFPLQRLAPHRSLLESPWIIPLGGGLTAPHSGTTTGTRRPPTRGAALGEREGRAATGAGRRHRSVQLPSLPGAAMVRASAGLSEANSWPSAVFYDEEKPTIIIIIITIIIDIIRIIIMIIIILIF